MGIIIDDTKVSTEFTSVMWALNEIPASRKLSSTTKEHWAEGLTQTANGLYDLKQLKFFLNKIVTVNFFYRQTWISDYPEHLPDNLTSVSHCVLLWLFTRLMQEGKYLQCAIGAYNGALVTWGLKKIEVKKKKKTTPIQVWAHCVNF